MIQNIYFKYHFGHSITYEKKLFWKFYIENKLGTSSTDENNIFHSWPSEYLDL